MELEWLSSDIPPSWKAFLEVEEPLVDRRQSPLRMLPCRMEAIFYLEQRLRRGKRFRPAYFRMLLPGAGAFAELKVALSGKEECMRSTILIEGEGMNEVKNEEMVRATAILGDLHLSIEDYCDLSPGMELQFKAPPDWRVVLQVGGYPVATAKFHAEEEKHYFTIEEIFDSQR